MGGTGIDIGVGLPVRAAGERGSTLLEWARRAEAGPFSSLAVPDRVVFDAVEPFVALAAVAGVTQRVRLMTSVLLAPTREASLLARQAASLDALSGGRFSLGVGVGIREDDYDASGSDFRARGRLQDALLPRLRSIWAGEEGIGPAPASQAGPELLIGGYVDAVARRIAAWGDGFMAPGGGEPARMAQLWGRIREAWRAAGRAGEPRWVSGSYFSLGPSAVDAARLHIDAWYGFNPELAERRLRGIPTSEDAVRDVIRRQQEMGAGELILRPVAGDLDALDRLADLVDGLGLSAPASASAPASRERA